MRPERVPLGWEDAWPAVQHTHLPQEDELVAGEDVKTGEPNPTMSGGLPLASCPIITATNRPKRTSEQNLDIMAEAMNTLTNRVADMQEQIGHLQQDKVNTS